MNFVVKTPDGDPGRVVDITPEIIAGQRVGSRLDFRQRQDFTVEFDNGALMLDEIDLMIYILPNEFFCYRGDDFVAKFILDSRKIQIDHRPIGKKAARNFIAPCR